MKRGKCILFVCALVMWASTVEAQSVIQDWTGIPTMETFDVVTWNIEHFGREGHGPDDIGKQYENIITIIDSLQADVIGLQEMYNIPLFNQLVEDLEDYDGFITDYSASSLQVAFLFHKDRIEFLDSRLLDAEFGISDFDVNRRPPLEFTFRVQIGEVSDTMHAVTYHARHATDEESYNRRVNASESLKAYFDEYRSDQALVFLGDFNDDVIKAPRGFRYPPPYTPYHNFVEDTSYAVVSKPLSYAGDMSHERGMMIDHIVVNHHLKNLWMRGSEQVHLPFYIDDYFNTTSDHLPVIARFDLTGELEPQGDRIVVVEPDNYPEEIGNLNRVIEVEIGHDPETIFVLRRDAVYWTDKSIENNGYHLQLRSEKGTGKPPVIRPGINRSGTSDHLFYTSDDVSFEGIFLVPIDEEGMLRRPLVHQSDGNTIRFVDGYIFGSYDFMFWFSGGSGNSLYIANSIFANAGRNDSRNQGRFIDTGGYDQDTIWVEHSTIYNMQHSFTRNPGGVIRYIHYNHNTIYNVAQYIRLGRVIHATVTNNLMINMYTIGLHEDTSGGIIEFAPLGVLGMTEAARTFNISHNNIGHVTDDVFESMLSARLRNFARNMDKAPIVDEFFMSMTDPDMGAKVTFRNNFEEPVTFTDPPKSFAEWTVFWIESGSNNDVIPEDYPMGYDRWNEAAETTDPSAYHYSIELVRDFSYSTNHRSYTAAESGFPVGDLNWFPEQLDAWRFGQSPVNVSDQSVDIPEKFRLLGNYPNPFNPVTRIRYEISTSTDAAIEVYDITGRLVISRELGVLSPGRYDTALDLSDHSSGVYLVRLRAGSEVQAMAITLVK